MTTSRADYQYIVKELCHEKGSVFALECYPRTKQLPFVSGFGCMYIELNPSATETDAKELMDMLNKHASYITVIEP